MRFRYFVSTVQLENSLLQLTLLLSMVCCLNARSSRLANMAPLGFGRLVEYKATPKLMPERLPRIVQMIFASYVYDSKFHLIISHHTNDAHHISSFLKKCHYDCSNVGLWPLSEQLCSCSNSTMFHRGNFSFLQAGWVGWVLGVCW